MTIKELGMTKEKRQVRITIASLMTIIRATIPSESRFDSDSDVLSTHTSSTK